MRAIVRLSLDQSSNTYATRVLARAGLKWRGTSLYESDPGTDLKSVLAGLRDLFEAIEMIESNDDDAHLDHLWIYIDQHGAAAPDTATEHPSP